jgi:DNA-directed RNA polymerase subunit M/transcription elongation factor TFIIS
MKKYDITIKDTDNSATVLHIIKKYPDFITEQSNNISYDLVCYAQQSISRSTSILEIDKYIYDMSISMEIESGIFEYSLLYVVTNNLLKQLISSVYNHKIYDLTKNMDMNSELISDAKSNRIKPRMMAFMSPSQLCPQKWETLLAKKHLKEEKENNLPTTDIYKCRKCDQRKCTVSLLQTRSIDEPMTVFVRCCNCYNTWTV